MFLAGSTEDQRPDVVAFPDVFNRRKEGIRLARPHGNIIKPGVNADQYIYVAGEVVRVDSVSSTGEPVKR